MQGDRYKPVQVHVIAPPMVAWGLERLIQTAHPRIEFTGSSATADAATLSMEKCPADVLVAAFDTADGVSLIDHFQSRVRSGILMVTSSQEPSLMDRAVLAGARGVVRTQDPPTSLLKAIEKVHEGELWIDRGATSRIFLEMARQKAAQGNDPERSRMATLTSREKQTIAALASDAAAPAKVIARRLCISEHTLRNHLTSIYSKLELSNRLDLYAYATRHHMTELR